MPCQKGFFRYLELNSYGVIDWEKTYGGQGNDEAISVISINKNEFIVASNSNSSYNKKSQIKKKSAEKNQANTKIKTSKTEQTVIKKSKTAEIKIKKSLAMQKVVKKNSKSKTKNIINALKDVDKQVAALAHLPTK